MSNAIAKRKDARGGFRAGSGRKPGGMNEKNRILAEKAVEDGVTPMDVMITNMRYYHDRAENFDRQLEEVASIMTPAQIAAGGEQVMTVLKLIVKVGEFRMKAQECAVDAAPYVHPRLAALAIKVSNGDSKKVPLELTQAMTPALAAEAYAALNAEDD